MTITNTTAIHRAQPARSPKNRVYRTPASRLPAPLHLTISKHLFVVIRQPLLLLLLLLLTAPPMVSAQSVSGGNIERIKGLRGSSVRVIEAVQMEISNKTGFAMLNPDYPVTPGDTYKINYLYELTPTAVSFFIESDYKANLGVFGIINTKNMSFRELKVSVENKVVQAYPGSMPQLVITATGVFPVLVRGEVTVPGFEQAWGFSRLSDIIADRVTKHTSLRNITIIPETGPPQTYDLFEAALESDLEKNPVISPGDTVVLQRYETEVYIQGEVFRPGSYQIGAAESLETLLNTYARGLTRLANESKIHIIRLNNREQRTATIYINGDTPSGSFSDVELQDMDLVVVPSVTEQVPLVFFEGKLNIDPNGEQIPPAVQNAASAAGGGSIRVPWPITAGQRISTALRNLPAGAITAVNDLENTYIIRKSEDRFIPVDLHALVYDRDFSHDPVLQDGDVIIIPTRLRTVIVGGAVTNPGPQAYIAGKTYLDYVMMAGGFDIDAHRGNKVVIIDRQGMEHGKERDIQPEDRIYVPRNNPRYIYTELIGPVIVTTSSIVSLLYTIYQIINNSN